MSTESVNRTPPDWEKAFNLAQDDLRIGKIQNIAVTIIGFLVLGGAIAGGGMIVASLLKHATLLNVGCYVAVPCVVVGTGLIIVAYKVKDNAQQRYQIMDQDHANEFVIALKQAQSYEDLLQLPEYNPADLQRYGIMKEHTAAELYQSIREYNEAKSSNNQPSLYQMDMRFVTTKAGYLSDTASAPT